MGRGAVIGYTDDAVTVWVADALDVLPTLPAASVDPFLGSGTTADACVREGFRCWGIEREPDYLPLIRARLTAPIPIALDFDGFES